MIYFYDINAKLAFLNNLLFDMIPRSTFFLDFDTQFSSYLNSKVFSNELNNNFPVKIIIPFDSNSKNFVHTIFQSNNYNSTMIIDSLNGMMDYFNFYRKINGTQQLNNTSIFGRNEQADYKEKKNKRSGGYLSLNFLFFILQKFNNWNNSIIVTCYQSISNFEKIKTKLLSINGFSKPETNHFNRLSKTIFLCETFDFPFGTFVTIFKKNDPDTLNKVINTQRLFFPHTCKLNENLF